MTDHGRRGLPAWLVGSGVIAVAMGVMNLTTYAFTILAARLLGPRQYGVVAALMGLLLVLNVLALGLQATGARRISTSPQDTATIESQVLAVAYRAALALGGLTLLATPVVTWALRLEAWSTAALVALAAVPLTVMGGQAGVLQGERRWSSLACIYLAMGVGRLAVGAVAMLWRADPLGAMVGVTLGAWAPVLVGWFALRHPGRQTRPGGRPTASSALRLLKEVVGNSHALLAFFALSNADVVVARTVLPDHPAGLYAGGLILAKAVLFLPQFVVVIAFPSMAAEGATPRAHLKGLGLVLGLGLCAVVGSAVLPDLAVAFVGGPRYAELAGLLWAFAVLGTLLAMIQLMVYNVVARQRRRSVYLVWGGLTLVVTAAPFAGSLHALLASVMAVEAAVLVALVAVSLRHAPAPDGQEPAGTVRR